MSNIKDLDSTAIYAYTTLISVLICVPAALIFEGPHLKAAAAKALESHPDFYFSLFLVGLLYHLYNQVRFLLHSSCLPSLSTHNCPCAALDMLSGEISCTLSLATRTHVAGKGNVVNKLRRNSL